MLKKKIIKSHYGAGLKGIQSRGIKGGRKRKKKEKDFSPLFVYICGSPRDDDDYTHEEKKFGNLSRKKKVIDDQPAAGATAAKPVITFRPVICVKRFVLLLLLLC
jgi:hypothetical protein